MMIDRLESRLMYANLSGRVFTDNDSSETFDDNESARRGTTVFLDTNLNGVLDAGEQTATTNKKGRYTFTGLPNGDYTVGTTTDLSTYKSTNAATGTKKGDFEINIVGLEDAAPSLRAAFAEAKIKWESVITGDVPDVSPPGGLRYDDVTLNVSVGTVDDIGTFTENLFAFAGPDAVRKTSSLPYLGSIRLDAVDLPILQANGHLNDVVLREVGEALGFGTTWTAQGLLSGRNGSNPRFIGQNAVREYDRLFATSNLSVPVQFGGEDNPRNGHWRESALHEEVMSTTTEFAGQLEPLSTITVGQFEDEGYTVDYDAADVWNPATHEVTKTVATDFGGVAGERTITLSANGINDLDFGYRLQTAPVIRSFNITPSPVVQGRNIVLTAQSIRDEDGDTLAAVSFYHETNGIEGLQKGSDERLVIRTFARNRAYKVQTSTAGLLGDQTYYVLATDSQGRVGRRVGVVNVVNTAPPEAPTDLAVRQRSNTTIRFNFTESSTDVNGYRIQIATKSDFSDQSLVRAFNIGAESTTVTIGGLREGVTYFIRVRGQNFAGSGYYSTPFSFETT